MFLVLPVALISVVPISIAGWGVREGAMVAAFAYAGLSQSDGLLISILFGISYLLLGVLGGVVWVLDTQQTERDVVADGINRPEGRETASGAVQCVAVIGAIPFDEARRCPRRSASPA